MSMANELKNKYHISVRLSKLATLYKQQKFVPLYYSIQICVLPVCAMTTTALLIHSPRTRLAADSIPTSMPQCSTLDTTETRAAAKTINKFAMYQSSRQAAVQASRVPHWQLRSDGSIPPKLGLWGLPAYPHPTLAEAKWLEIERKRAKARFTTSILESSQVEQTMVRQSFKEKCGSRVPLPCPKRKQFF